jgi:hypothetical protein
MNDRSVLFNNLGSMYGMLVFFESAVDETLSVEREKSAMDQMFPDEIGTLADAHLGLGMARKSFERLVGQLSGVDKVAFVDGLASTAESVADEAFNGSGEISE